MKQVYDGMASFLGIDTTLLQLELMRACKWSVVGPNGASMAL